MGTKTYSPKGAELEHRWWVVDAEGQILGRLATLVASRLRGKGKPTYAPHMNGGDFVVVVNAEKVRVTGRKLEQKVYTRHSGYPGGLRQITLGDQLQKHPERVIESAVRGMLPHNTLGHHLMNQLKVYAGPKHPHAAQKPEPWALTLEATGGSAA
jgi:large subunit ribosomal protein L13